MTHTAGGVPPARFSLVTRPANGRLPALSSEVERRVRESRDFRSRFGEYDHPELRPFAERCIRVDDETMLYEFTVEDPTTYTEAWGGEIPIRRLDAQLYAYACHEGNYSLAGVLSGARYRERMEAQGPTR